MPEDFSNDHEESTDNPCLRGIGIRIAGKGQLPVIPET